MKHVAGTRVLALSLVTTMTAAAAPVSAVEKDECIAAYEATQQLRKDGKLSAAREKALFCAQDGCPNVIRDDCTAWVGEIDKSVSTIVLVVTDPAGKDVVDVTVTLDGTTVKSKLDGKAI